MAPKVAIVYVRPPTPHTLMHPLTDKAMGTTQVALNQFTDSSDTVFHVRPHRKDRRSRKIRH